MEYDINNPTGGVTTRSHKGAVMIYGYASILISEYEIDTGRLDFQIDTLRMHGAMEIYVDKNLAMVSHRPRLEELLGVLEAGDTVIITKLSKLAWDMNFAARMIATMLEKGVEVNILKTGVMDNTDATADVKKAFFSFADFEREIVVEKMREGKRVAKNNPDFKEGRPKVYDENQIEEALELLKTNSYKQVEAMTGISKSTLIRAKRERAVKLVKENYIGKK